MEISEIIPSEQVREVKLSRERVEIRLRNGQVIVIEPTYSHEIIHCKKGDDDCIRENLYLSMTLE